MMIGLGQTGNAPASNVPTGLSAQLSTYKWPILIGAGLLLVFAIGRGK